VIIDDAVQIIFLYLRQIFCRTPISELPHAVRFYSIQRDRLPVFDVSNEGTVTWNGDHTALQIIACLIFHGSADLLIPEMKRAFQSFAFVQRFHPLHAELIQGKCSLIGNFCPVFLFSETDLRLFIFRILRFRLCRAVGHIVHTVVRHQIVGRIQIQLIGSIVRRLCTEINVIFLVCIVLPDFSYIRQHRGLKPRALAKQTDQHNKDGRAGTDRPPEILTFSCFFQKEIQSRPCQNQIDQNQAAVQHRIRTVPDLSVFQKIGNRIVFLIIRISFCQKAAGGLFVQNIFQKIYRRFFKRTALAFRKCLVSRKGNQKTSLCLPEINFFLECLIQFFFGLLQKDQHIRRIRLRKPDKLLCPDRCSFHLINPVVQRNSIQLLPVISFFFHNADFHLGLEEAFTRNRFFPTVHRVPLAVLQAQDTKRRIFHQKPCRKSLCNGSVRRNIDWKTVRKKAVSSIARPLAPRKQF